MMAEKTGAGQVTRTDAPHAETMGSGSSKEAAAEAVTAELRCIQRPGAIQGMKAARCAPPSPRSRHSVLCRRPQLQTGQLR
jgi:hypothetical protein